MTATWLVAGPEGPALLEEAPGSRPRVLPPGAIEAVFARYGKELDPSAVAALAEAPSLRLAAQGESSASLRHLRFRGWGSVHPNDYLVLEAQGREPLAAPAPQVAGALRALALAAQRARR